MSTSFIARPADVRRRASSDAVLFDLDETLVDRRGTLDRYARGLFADYRSSVTMPSEAFVHAFHDCDGNGLTNRQDFFNALALRVLPGRSAAQIREHYEAVAWNEPLLFPGVREALGTLREHRFCLGIVTNGKVQTQAKKLVQAGLMDLTHCQVISEAVGLRKPDRRIFELALTRLGVPVERASFVGDNPKADVDGAHQMGMRTAWVERHLPWPEGLPRSYDIALKQTRDVVSWVLR